MFNGVIPSPSEPGHGLSEAILVALDTSTERLHVALVVGESVRVRDLPGGARASMQLLPALQEMLDDASLQWADVDAIAFGSGPGAFTGLRTACAVTQGLALALDCPVIVLDTLMAVAEDARRRASTCVPGQTLWVLQDARMDELYAASFRWSGQCWLPVEGPFLWPLAEPLRRWAHVGSTSADAPSLPGEMHLCGNAFTQCKAALADLPDTLIWSDGAQAVPSGAALAVLARQAWAAGRTVDAALALPRYVRDKVAQTTDERAAERMAAVAQQA
jgi:tRNA threonylcarbamoyladenosine biosynthesis protein TsaB